jgi:hypothetical protein
MSVRLVIGNTYQIGKFINSKFIGYGRDVYGQKYFIFEGDNSNNFHIITKDDYFSSETYITKV